MNCFEPYLNLDSIYVTVLEPLENGLSRMRNTNEIQREECQKTHSPLFDALAYVLATTTYSKPLSIARALGVSSADLNGAVKIAFGLTLSNLILDYRIRQILELAAATDYAPSKVASRCGMSSEKVMFNLFSRKMNFTFMHYRKSHQKKIYHTETVVN